MGFSGFYRVSVDLADFTEFLHSCWFLWVLLSFTSFAPGCTGFQRVRCFGDSELAGCSRFLLGFYRV